MSAVVSVLTEPSLEFRYGQKTVDPHDGLSLFGPCDVGTPSHPENISFGLVGTPKGCEGFQAWSRRVQRTILPGEDNDRRLWPTYPGFEAAFSCSWPPAASRTVELDELQLSLDARENDPNVRASRIVDKYLESIRRIQLADDPVDVIVCVVPDIVWVNCRPKSRIRDGVGFRASRAMRQAFRAGQRDFFDDTLSETFNYSPDFRRQIKARSMASGTPIQIIRESTLIETDARQLTPLCDRAWNLSVALYYKAGGKPWRLSGAREGVSYIGLAYRQTDPASASPTACCAAQMFLDSGDGIVFRGEDGPWYSPDTHACHLSSDAARRLLEGALRSYSELEGKPLREIFLHCRSGLEGDEFAGFKQACPAGVSLVGVRVRPERQEVRLFREGTRPVLRGTFWRTAPRRGYLWASGFKPHLGTYDGWEVPVPLRVDVQFGDSDVERVAQDILGLTKLNYNACRLGEGQPVTVGFSDAVGEILVSNPTVSQASTKLRFYI
jgi:hypothetical protein